MKIAFTTSGNTLTAPLDQRFGRAAGFLIYDDQTKTIDYVNNEKNLNAAQGAGIQTAVQIAAQKVDILITGHCGPKAFSVLQSAGIKVYPSCAETVNSAYTLFCDGQLSMMDQADVEGHWS